MKLVLSVNFLHYWYNFGISVKNDEECIHVTKYYSKSMNDLLEFLPQSIFITSF